MSKLVKIVNLEAGLPTVEEARERLQREIFAARRQGITLLKLVHGYGSSGVGGDLRFSLQATLRQMAERKEIGDCIFGENWRTSDDRSWALLKRFPELKSDRDLGRANRGITIVWLR